MNKQRLISIPTVVRACLAILLVSLLLQSTPAQATNDLPPTPLLFPAQQQDDDPAAQCAEGVQLYLDGKPVEAYPLLEAGFAGRESATFANPDDEAGCAFALGLLLHNSIGNQSGALEAYQVARDIFQATGNRKLEGTTVDNMGLLYYAQGKYAEALASFQQALEISQKVKDRTREGWMANSIGLVYSAQGKYAEAEASYEQALDILREVEDRAGEATTTTNIAALYLAQGKYDQARVQIAKDGFE